MSQYFRTSAMQTGGPFTCFNCNKLLAAKLKGHMSIEFKCPRCHARINIEMNEPIDWENDNAKHKPAS